MMPMLAMLNKSPAEDEATNVCL